MKETARQIRYALCKALAIEIERLAGLIGDGFGDRERLQQPKKGDSGGVGGKIQEPAELHHRNMRGGQAARHRAGHADRGLAVKAGHGPAGEIGADANDDENGQHVELRPFFAAHDAAKQHRQRQRHHRGDDRLEVDRVARRQRQPQPMQHMLRARALFAKAKRVADLADRQQQRGRAHESEDHRFRDVASEIAQTKNRDEYLDGAHHHAKQEHRLRRFDALLGIEDRQGAEHDQRNRAGRAVDEVRGRTEHGGDGGD